MARDCFAKLAEGNPLYDIFQGGCVPIMSILPEKGELIGSAETLIYKLDHERCSDEQLSALAERLGRLQGGNKTEVMEAIKTVGLPIRGSQVTVVSGGPNTMRALL